MNGLPDLEVMSRVLQMHLGYHELRNMLSKFREDREKRKMAPPSSATPSGGAGSGSARTGSDRGGEHRGLRDDRDRERERGYERHSSSRYE